MYKESIRQKVIAKRDEVIKARADTVKYLLNKECDSMEAVRATRGVIILLDEVIEDYEEILKEE